MSSCGYVWTNMILFIFVDVYGQLWIFMDVYGENLRNGWMCQNRLEFMLISGIYLKWFLDRFGVVINGSGWLEII